MLDEDGPKLIEVFEQTRVRHPDFHRRFARHRRRQIRRSRGARSGLRIERFVRSGLAGKTRLRRAITAPATGSAARAAADINARRRARRDGPAKSRSSCWSLAALAPVGWRLRARWRATKATRRRTRFCCPNGRSIWTRWSKRCAARTRNTATSSSSTTDAARDKEGNSLDAVNLNRTAFGAPQLARALRPIGPDDERFGRKHRGGRRQRGLQSGPTFGAIGRR